MTQAQAKTTHAKGVDHQRNAVKMLGRLERRPLAGIVLCLHSLKLLLATNHAVERPLVGCGREGRVKSDEANTVQDRSCMIDPCK